MLSAKRAELVAAAVAGLTPEKVAEYRAAPDKMVWVLDTCFHNWGIDAAESMILAVEDAIDAL